MAAYSRANNCLYVLKSYMKFLLSGNVLDYPYKIQLQTGTLCNGRCIFCPYPDISGEYENGDMDIEIFHKIVDETCLESNTSEIIFELQNEPLLDKRTFSFIEYVKSRNKNIACTLVTNGQLIQNYDLEEIKRSGLDKLIVSLNANTAGTYEKISGGMKFDVIKNNIDRIVQDPEIKRILQISFVVIEQNAAEVNQALKYWKQQGVRTRAFKISNRSGVLTSYEEKRSKTVRTKKPFLQAIWENTLKTAFKVTGCYFPFANMAVLFNGDVIICCNDWKRAFIAGNLKESSIKEVWNSVALNKARKLIIRKNYSQINTCARCSKAI